MATTNFYAGAGDGGLNADNNATWSTLHDATSSTAVSPTVDNDWVGSYFNGSVYNIRRVALPVDTSALGGGVTIDSATLNVWLYNKQDKGLAGSYFNVVETFQASTSTLGVSDFIDIGSDNGTAGRANQTPIEKGSTDKTISSCTDGGYNIFTLNATGEGWIDKVGTTKIGLRNGHDILDTAPAQGAANWDGMQIYFSEKTGTANDPYLAVTYTTGPAAYTLIADTMAMVLTYNAVLFNLARKIAAATMSMALTFADVILTYAPVGASLVVDTMALALTYNAVLFKRGVALVVNTMAMVLTFNATLFKRTYNFVIDTMAMALTFLGVTLRVPGKWVEIARNATSWSNKSKS